MRNQGAPLERLINALHLKLDILNTVRLKEVMRRSKSMASKLLATIKQGEEKLSELLSSMTQAAQAYIDEGSAAAVAANAPQRLFPSRKASEQTAPEEELPSLWLHKQT